MRCHKSDGDRHDVKVGYLNRAGHRGRCKIRPNPDAPAPTAWPLCREPGCARQVKHQGSLCPRHRGLMNRGIPRRASIRPDPDGAPPPARPTAPATQAAPHKAGIAGLQVWEVIANKAARVALVGLARMILKTYEDLDAEKARRREQVAREERRMA